MSKGSTQRAQISPKFAHAAAQCLNKARGARVNTEEAQRKCSFESEQKNRAVRELVQLEETSQSDNKRKRNDHRTRTAETKIPQSNINSATQRKSRA